jgi:hypothetical protein
MIMVMINIQQRWDGTKFLTSQADPVSSRVLDQLFIIMVMIIELVL